MPAVIIIGGHRTGTSLTAQVIHRLGFPAAPRPDRLLTPKLGCERDNPDGYWEDIAFVRIHRRMLGEGMSSLGGWRNPRRDDAVIARLRGEYLRLIRERAGHSENWCLKDPRLCLLGDVLFDALEEQKIPFRIVTTCRDLPAVEGSLMRRGLKAVDAGRLAEQFELGRLAMCHWARSRSRPVHELALLSLRCEADVQRELRRLQVFLNVAETSETMAVSQLVRIAGPAGSL